MPTKDFDAVFFVKQPPDIRIEDGLVHIGYDIGTDARFEIVFTRHTFMLARRRAEKVARELTGAKIVPLKNAKPAHH